MNIRALIVRQLNEVTNPDLEERLRDLLRYDTEPINWELQIQVAFQPSIPGWVCVIDAMKPTPNGSYSYKRERFHLDEVPIIKQALRDEEYFDKIWVAIHVQLKTDFERMISKIKEQLFK